MVGTAPTGFQSTLSWGERRYKIACLFIRKYFNPRSPGESDVKKTGEFFLYGISIHALLGRATYYLFVLYHVNNNLNPRSPGESDTIGTTRAINAYNFNPRSPGESDLIKVFSKQWKAISIHALLGRATEIQTIAAHHEGISIHALLGRATTSEFYQVAILNKFQSTLSWGERLVLL